MHPSKEDDKPYWEALGWRAHTWDRGFPGDSWGVQGSPPRFWLGRTRLLKVPSFHPPQT